MSSEMEKGTFPKKEIVVETPLDSETMKPLETMNMAKHWAATAALCLAMFCQTYLFLSVFTYSGFMAMYLIPGLTSETAGSRAGLISSSYMFGRTLSSYAWGTIADTIGRKPVFYLSFLIPGICSVWFGLATSMGSALFARFMMGVGNGLMLAAKTTVSELARGDEQLEAKGMGLVMGMWGWGFLVCPAISGMLAEPVKQYPDLGIVQYFEPLLSKYPFLLPNLVSIVMCVAGSLGVYLFVDETLPEEKRKTFGSLFEGFVTKIKSQIESYYASEEERLPLKEVVINKGTYGNSSQKLFETAVSTTENSSKGTNVEEEDGLMNHTESCVMLSTSPSSAEDENDPFLTTDKKQSAPTMASLWANVATRDHLIGYWLLSFISIVLDEAFPLFCIAANAGLNVTETGIGKILSGAGLMFVLAQFSIYSYIMAQHGLYKSQIIGSLLSTPITMLMPISLYLNRGATQANDLSWSAYIFLCLVLGCKNIFNNVAFSSITIATNRTVASNHRASVNGLSMLGGSVVKAMGPVSAGFLVSFLLGGTVFPPQMGAILLFVSISSFGLLCVFYITVVLKRHYKGSSLTTSEE